MATIKEDFVSFEIAKLLKEKGFEIDTTKDYWKIGPDGTKYFMCSIGAYTSDINNKYAYYRPADSYPCPTQAMVMKWLREVHSLHIWIGHAAGKGLSWYYEIHGISDGKVKHIGGIQCGSYEVACEAAIKFSLENLI